MNLLIIEDDINLNEGLFYAFENDGFNVFKAYTKQEGLNIFNSKNIDFIILDCNLPDGDGFDVCQIIREKSDIPIIMLTARDSEIDEVKGLEIGLDDYITKPFSMDELFARVQAHLRREKRSSHKSRGHFTRELIIDYSQRTVIIKNKKIDFSNKEFEIIKLLSMNAGQIFDREKIYEVVWGFEANGDSAVIKEHIRKIRMKLARYSENEYLETVWGVGYRWKK